jgi:hypothetical protein
MTELVRLGVGLILLFLTLSFAMSFLAGPMSLLKKAGVFKTLRWFLRGVWRSLAFIFQLVTRTRRLHVRRPGARHAVRRAG